jgi:hypothetical protein
LSGLPIYENLAAMLRAGRVDHPLAAPGAQTPEAAHAQP